MESRRMYSIDGEYDDEQGRTVVYDIILIGFEDIVDRQDLLAVTIDVLRKRMMYENEKQKKEDDHGKASYK